MFFVFISLLAGVSVVASRIINFKLSEEIGIFQGTLINYIVGLIFSFIFLLFSSEPLSLTSLSFHSIPLWAYLGGLTGVAVVVLSSYITPRMSAFYITLLVFIGQLFLAVIIDYFTLNVLSAGKIIGGLLVLLGLSYNLLIDKKQTSEALSAPEK